MQRKPGSTSGREGVFLRQRPGSYSHPPTPPFLRPTRHCHLGQAGEEAGAAGGAAADRGEGIPEDEASAGQGIQVRGGDGTVVVRTALKASIIR